MPLQIVRNDITRMRVDAIVSATEETLSGSGGVSAVIRDAAGEGYAEACAALSGCEPGAAVATGGFSLPAKYVIHTVGPVWHGGGKDEEKTLRACYRSVFLLAEQLGCESVACPLVSAGSFGYPADAAFSVALEEAERFLAHSDLTVYLVVYARPGAEAAAARFPDLKSYIDDNYVASRDALYGDRQRTASLNALPAYMQRPPEPCGYAAFDSAPPPAGAKASAPAKKRGQKNVFSRKKKAQQAPAASFAEMAMATEEDRIPLPPRDESFAEMLLRLIDERGLTDAAVYKKANVDRRLFSKIRSDPLYRPSKPTAVAFAVALELSPDETRELLMKAGYALSHAFLFDIIIEYFITRGNYNIFDINEALFSYDQTLLGA